MAFTLPKRVQIGSHNFKVETVRGRHAEDVDYYGYYNGTTNTIGIIENLPETRAAEVFLHEAFHGMFNNAGLRNIRGIGENEELIVDNLSRAMAQFMRDNPSLTKSLVATFSKV